MDRTMESRIHGVKCRLLQYLNVHERAHATLIEKFFTALESELRDNQERPSPPRVPVPEDVRNYLDLLIGPLSEGSSDYHLKQSARRWLESAPVATDKATCPKCGREHASLDMRAGRVFCECSNVFKVRVLVISPPREGKGTP